MKKSDFWKELLEILFTSGLLGLILIPLLRRMAEPRPALHCELCSHVRKLARVAGAVAVAFLLAAAVKLGWRIF